MGMMKRALTGAAWTACLLVTAQAAQADFLFNPAGTGGVGNATSISAFANSPGNELAQGGVTAINRGPGATFQLYYQASLGNLVSSATGNPFTPVGLNTSGPTGYQITMIASVTEVVTSVNTSINTATFAVAPVQSPNSYLVMYQNTGVVGTAAGANNLTGTGFNGGAVILTGTPHASGPGVANFTTVAGTTAPFDQHSNAYPGINSVVGNGSSTVEFNVTSFNPNFFFTPPPVLDVRLAMGLSTPFLQIDPSMSFPGRPGDATVLPAIGATNGLTGPDFQFVSQGQLTSPGVIPEPSSVVLLGLGIGLGGLIAFAWKRKSEVD
jgi:hypothetical protein